MVDMGCYGAQVLETQLRRVRPETDVSQGYNRARHQGLVDSKTDSNSAGYVQKKILFLVIKHNNSPDMPTSTNNHNNLYNSPA